MPPVVTLLAEEVEFKGDRLVGDDGDHFEIQGFITDLRSQADFVVSNVVTVACGTGCTVTTEGAAGGTLALNSKVEVKGEYDNGVLVATSVDIRLGKAIRVTAVVDSPPSDGMMPLMLEEMGSLVILGNTFGVDGGNRTRFEDKSGQDSEFSNIGEIQAGDYVEVRGGVDGDGNLFAVIVELEELAVDVVATEVTTIIQGFQQHDLPDPLMEPFPTLSILDVIVESNAATDFEDENDNPINDPAVFFGMIQAGSLIKAKGTMATGTPLTLLAEEVEIQVE
jgi:hypothetical protein